MKDPGPMTASGERRIGRPRGFWVKALGVVLLFGSVGLVSCQALFVL